MPHRYGGVTKTTNMGKRKYTLFEILWHDTEEEPIPNRPILVEKKDLHGSVFSVDANQGRWNQGRWEEHRRINNIIRWLYIEDLLPYE